MIRNTQWDDVT